MKTIVMAGEERVKQYLAYWFQLGKKIVLGNGQESLLPQPIFEGNSYSQSFQDCWERILSCRGGAYLEGTHQSIEQLLTPAWDIIACARCEMPVPASNVGLQSSHCPCQELPNWPNLELPRPHFPANSQEHLSQIRQRLLET